MKTRAALWIISLVGVVLLGAGLFAPYDESLQNRARALEGPARLGWAREGWQIRPYVWDGGRRFPIRFFPPGAGVRLFGVDEPGRIFLLGTDQYGRDLFSRLLYGGRRSVVVGIVAAAVTLVLGLVVGGLAGFYGGWLDQGLMRLAELFLALPWLYLLLAVRAVLPLSLTPVGAFGVLIVITAVAGWARPARLIRGVFLSVRERPYVQVAKSFGASGPYLIRRHLLPETYGILLAQAVVLIPQYILADVTLSFLGLGAGEPAATWGGMLASALHFDLLESHWGVLCPLYVLVPLFFSFYILAEHRANAARRESWLEIG